MTFNESGEAGTLNNDLSLRTEFFNSNCSYVNKNCFSINPNKLTFLGLNVQSLLAKEIELASFIDNLNDKPYLICLPEIHQIGEDPPTLQVITL